MPPHGEDQAMYQLWEAWAAHITSIVIKDSLKDFNFSHSPPLAYFYCSQNPAEPVYLKPKAIFTSIIRQLINLKSKNPLLKLIIINYKNKKKKGFYFKNLNIRESY